MAKARREGRATAGAEVVTYTGHSAQSGAAMRGSRYRGIATSSRVIDVESSFDSSHLHQSAVTCERARFLRFVGAGPFRPESRCPAPLQSRWTSKWRP